MEWKLEPDALKEYSTLLRNAQELEMNIGSSVVRVNKLVKMRDDVDGALKTWWDFTLKTMKLDPKRDYSISADGTIVDVSKEVPAQPQSRLGTNASELS